MTRFVFRKMTLAKRQKKMWRSGGTGSTVKEHTVWWEVQVSKLCDTAGYIGGFRKRSRGTPNADNLWA